MFKKSLFLILAATLFIGIDSIGKGGEDVPKPNLPLDDEGKITYTEVVEVPGVAADVLYSRIHNWFNSYFKSPSSVIQNADKENAKVEGRDGMNIYGEDKKGNRLRAGMVKYSITVEAKEGRYRFVITEFEKIQNPKIPAEEWLNEEDSNRDNNYRFLTQIDEEMQKMIEDLKKNVKTKSESDGDDW